MFQINNITAEAIQTHTLLFEENEITLTLRYLEITQTWHMDVVYLGVDVTGVVLSRSVLHMRARNYPFDFIVEANDKSDLDPFLINDFASGRCSLYLVDRAEMKATRGLDVAI